MSDQGTLVTLGLGSNAGDSRNILRGALVELSALLTGMRSSSLYITRAMEVTDQADFCNMVVQGYYSGTPETLHSKTAEIETRYGRDREREIPKGPRTLDIDIELFGTETVRTDTLHVPHERMHQRQFVLIPLLEICPDCADPVTGIPYGEIAKALPDQGVRKAGVIW